MVSSLFLLTCWIKDRDFAWKTSEVMYAIPYNCGRNYKGGTKLALETRLKEHQAITRKGKTEMSDIAEHDCSQHHQPLKEETDLHHTRNNNTMVTKKPVFNYFILHAGCSMSFWTWWLRKKGYSSREGSGLITTLCSYYYTDAHIQW